MSDLVLNYDAAHRFVDRTAKARWEGWDIVLFSANDYAWNNPKGAFRNERWGIEERISPDTKGLWKVKTSRRKANA